MISPLAYVDASAKLGANVTVHPFAYVDKNVEIGDDCEIMPHVSIMSGTRIGKRNRIFNGAVIAAEPQDFNYKGDDTIVEIGDDNVIRENVVINRATNSVTVKSVFYLFFVILDCFQLGFCSIIKIRITAPLLIYFHIIHLFYLFTPII